MGNYEVRGDLEQYRPRFNVESEENTRKETGLARKIIGAISTLTLLAGISFGTYFAGNKEPHNKILHGVVKDEKELYIKTPWAYTTERSDVKKFLEENIGKGIDIGKPRRLYKLKLTGIEYETVEWFERKKYSSKASEEEIIEFTKENFRSEDAKVIYLLSRRDIADIGDKFKISFDHFTRMPKTWLGGGIKYTTKDQNGKDETLIIKDFYQNPEGLNFTKD